MRRWQAALIHLGLSATVAAVASALLLGVWYPPPYFQADGGLRLLKLIVGVDITLGPLLTLIVFKSGKPGLKFDLGAIAVMQAIALIYGFHVMLASRPVFLVAAVDRFNLVAANQLDPKDLAKASRPEWRHASWSGPVLVGTRMPTDPKARNALLFSSLAGKDIQQIPKYYVPYAEAVPGLLKRAHPVAMLRAMHPDHSAEIDAFLRDHGVSADAVVWLPVVARVKDLSMFVDKLSGKPIGAIALDPWPSDVDPHARAAAKRVEQQAKAAKAATSAAPAPAASARLAAASSTGSSSTAAKADPAPAASAATPSGVAARALRPRAPARGASGHR